MTEINMVMRKVEISEPGRPLTWEEVQAKKGRLNPFIWIVLLFVSYDEVVVPDKDMPCAMTTMSGYPLYIYKLFKGKTYLIKPLPSPGFPGS